MIRTTLPGLIPERSTRVITLKMRKEDGAPVDPTGIRCWLYDRRTGAAINGRTAQDILNTGGGTLGPGTGDFQLRLVENDTQCLDQDSRNEAHVCLIEYTWGSDGKEHHEVVMWIANMAKVS